MTEQLQKKIDFAIKLIQSAGKDGSTIEVCYSGGKDSDVILQLTKESGINYRAIYKNTTIDPPGTIKHAQDMGAEMVRPKQNFFELVSVNGFPNRFARHCCRYLKEYKVLDRSIIGVRKSESKKRAERYQEPTQCRFYGSKKEHVEAFYPILEWTDEDVAEFLADRKITCAPAYYDEQGQFHVERRLGCLACPLKSKTQRIADFKKYPNLVKAYLRGGQKFLDAHPNTKIASYYKDVYEWFVRDLFFDKQSKWEASRNTMFEEQDYKKFLEDYFNIKF